MTTVTGLTAARMLAIEAASIVNAQKSGDNLILYRHDGTPIDLGSIKGNTGSQGVKGDPGSGWVATELADAINLNNIVTPGIYTQSVNSEAASGSNYPLPVAGKLEVGANADASLVWQSYHAYSVQNRTFMRGRYNGTWANWVELGAVDEASTDYGSLSGSGTISNGGYEKKANGRLTCFIRFQISPVANTFTSRKWTFPVPFVNAPITQVTASSGAETIDNTQESAPTTTYVYVGLVRSNTTSTYLNAIAEGFWK